MMAAAAVLQAGGQVRLYEKNEKLGKKLYITGKGRCNLTNACGTEELFDKVVRNPKFLYSGFYGFTNFQVMAFMEENGCPVKVERGNRVFRGCVEKRPAFYPCPCGGCGNRRLILPFYRFHRRRLPFCRGPRA